MTQIAHLDNDYLSDFNEFVELVEGYKKGKIDGKMLAFILNLSFYCGLRRKEIPNCKIKSIFDISSQQVRENFLFDDPSFHVEIPLDVASAIKDYLDYLRSQGRKIESDSPLFPTYYSDKGKESSQEKKLTRHLNEILSSVHPIIRVRKLGIKSLYVSLSQSHSKESSIFSMIAQQYRITPREVKAVINDKINRAGNKDYIRIGLLKAVEKIEKLKRDDENFQQQIDQIISDFREVFEKYRTKTSKMKGENDLNAFIEMMLNDLGIIVDPDLMKWSDSSDT